MAEEPPGNTRDAQLQILSALIDVIDDAKQANPVAFPGISVVPNHPKRSVRDQIAGQLYAMDAATAVQAYDLVYERFVRTRKTPMPEVPANTRVYDVGVKSITRGAEPTPAPAKPLPARAGMFAAIRRAV